MRVWQFEPAPGREAEFAAAYSSDGVWARLFAQGDGFIGTSLLAPTEPGGSWLTVDRWESLAAFERFQEAHGTAYRKLDEDLTGLTAREHFVGAFEEPSG